MTGIPSAALINFAQRVDLLDELDKGGSDQQLIADHDTAAGKFAHYFDTAVNALIGFPAPATRV